MHPWITEIKCCTPQEGISCKAACLAYLHYVHCMKIEGRCLPFQAAMVSHYGACLRGARSSTHHNGLLIQDVYFSSTHAILSAFTTLISLVLHCSLYTHLFNDVRPN